jgi:hypothetical protein
VCYPLMHKFEVDRIQNTVPNSASIFCVRICCCAGMNWSIHVPCYSRWLVGQSAQKQSTHLGPTTRLPLLSDSCGPADMGRTPLPPMPDKRTGRHPQPLPALASAVNLGSESRGTRDHTPPSQIRDLPLCHLS